MVPTALLGSKSTAFQKGPEPQISEVVAPMLPWRTTKVTNLRQLNTQVGPLKSRFCLRYPKSPSQERPSSSRKHPLPRAKKKKRTVRGSLGFQLTCQVTKLDAIFKKAWPLAAFCFSFYELVHFHLLENMFLLFFPPVGFKVFPLLVLHGFLKLFGMVGSFPYQSKAAF